MVQFDGIQVAQIGIGAWGRNIYRNLIDAGALKWAYEADPTTVSRLSAESRGVTFVSTLEQILENPEIPAVVIATPASTHFRVAKAALLAGKDVFVEKPLSLKLAEGLELVKLAEEHRRVLMVGHVLQYHPAVQKLKELISNGTLGKVQYIYSNRLNIGKLRTEENILWSFAPHDISVILMLLGESPVRVAARGGDFLNKRVFDITMTTLEFRNGARGHIFVSWLNPFKEQKLVVVGSKSMAVFDDMAEQQLVLYPHEIEWKEGKIPVAQKAPGQPVPFEKAEPLRVELEHYLDCVRTRTQPLTDGVEGVHVLKILHLLEESLHEDSGKQVCGTIELQHRGKPVIV